MAVRLVYETHATTTDNEAGVCTGWRPGVLSERGRREAAELGRRRADVDLVVSSDLSRAVQTVEIAFAGSGMSRRTDARLREVDFGELTGDPVEAVEAARSSHVDEPFPGGRSYRQVVDDVRALLSGLPAEHDGGQVLLVAHAAPRYALDHLLTGRPLARAVTAPSPWRPGWEYVARHSLPTTEVLDGAGAKAVLDDLVDVYGAAFTPEPYGESAERIRQVATEQLPTHAARDGFRCAVVRENGRIRGFCYGYTGRRGQWWTDQVAANVPASVARSQLGGHLEVVELAVDPTVQNRGYGAALVDLLLEGAEHDRALLTTWHGDDRPAPRLYRRLGWQLLHEGVFPDSDLWGVELRRPSGSG